MTVSTNDVSNTVVNDLFVPKGRLSRKPYILYTILNVVLAVVFGFVGGVFIGLDVPIVGVSVLVVTVFLSAWVGFVLTFKRLHDIGLPGTHTIWIYLVPIAINMFLQPVGMLISFGVFLWLAFATSDDYENKYGPV